MMLVNYSDVLTEMYAGSEWSMSNEDYSTLEWLSDSPKPSQKDLDDKKDATAKVIADRELAKAANKAALLARLGITEDEAKLLLA